MTAPTPSGDAEPPEPHGPRDSSASGSAEPSGPDAGQPQPPTPDSPAPAPAPEVPHSGAVPLHKPGTPPPNAPLWGAGAPVEPDGSTPLAGAGRNWTGLVDELLVVVALVVASGLLGLLAGAIWHWIAPRVPVYADSSNVYLLDPEGEQQIAADAWFGLVGLCFGAVLGVAAYWFTRRRGGGVGAAIGLVLGGLLGSWAAWRLGTQLSGHHEDLLKLAHTVPLGHTFHRPLVLSAKGVLLAWPIAALVLLMSLISLLSPKKTHPEPQLPALGPTPEAGPGSR